MKRRITTTITALSLLLGFALWQRQQAVNAKAAPMVPGFTVNTTNDTADANPGDGVCADANGDCSLRAAISEANARAGDDTITLPAGTYTQTLAGADNANAGGDWDIASNVTIIGADAGSTIVQAATTAGTANDRVLQVVSGTVELRDLTLRHGRVSGSGGGVLNAGNLTLERVVVTQNLVRGDLATGGGIGNDGTLNIQDSTISNNTAQGLDFSFTGGTASGGGIANGRHRTLTVSGSTLSGNRAQGGNATSVGGRGDAGFGGGVADSNARGDTGSLTLTNCTFSNNTAQHGTGLDRNGEGRGGAIHGGAALITVIHSTISHNTASDEGGGMFSSSGATSAGPFLQNTIIANNTAPSGPDLRFNFRSLDYNLIGNTSGATFSGSTSTANDLTGVDPALGALVNNGGATETRLPGTMSQALNAIPNGANGCGTTIITDQRGVTRPAPAGGSCDIGAVEVVTNSAPIASCQNVTVAAGANCTATASINNGSSDPDGDSFTLSQSPAGPYPLGTTLVMLTVTDSHGASSSCQATVTVVDQTAPVITLNGANPLTVECANGFTDPGATALDNCTGTRPVTSTNNINLNVPGSYTITYSANDGNGNSATKTRTVNVVDTKAPLLTLKSDLTLWPPNHGYQTITMSQMVQSVVDGCNTSLNLNNVAIEKVTSDEPDNAPGGSDGNTTNDIMIAGNCQSVQLRSERDETKNGRVYVITLRVKDAAGNVTRKDFKVNVPIGVNGTAVQGATAQTKTSSCP
jgi:CSLREA domain-containing protein